MRWAPGWQAMGRPVRVLGSALREDSRRELKQSRDHALVSRDVEKLAALYSSLMSECEKGIENNLFATFKCSTEYLQWVEALFPIPKKAKGRFVARRGSTDINYTTREKSNSNGTGSWTDVAAPEGAGDPRASFDSARPSAASLEEPDTGEIGIGDLAPET